MHSKTKIDRPHVCLSISCNEVDVLAVHFEGGTSQSMEKRPRMPSVVGWWTVYKVTFELIAHARKVPSTIAHHCDWRVGITDGYEKRFAKCECE